MMVRGDITHLAEPAVQRCKLRVTEHGVRRGVFSRDIRAVPPRVHDEECGIPIAEVVVVLLRLRRLIVGFRVVNGKRVGGIREGLLRAIPLPCIVVDDLFCVQDLVMGR